MTGRGLAPERVQLVLDYLAALNPMQAARAAGVSKSVAYVLDRQVSGVSRLAVKREAAAAREGRRAARGDGRKVAREREQGVLEITVGL